MGRFQRFSGFSGRTAAEVGSCAMKIHEPRQVRKEATVSDPFHVPQGCLISAVVRREKPRGPV
ncbi:hypothetical protein ALO_17761 [Acetonema longum DSM 6540]|uniref:Uncharacterized protein n=1 Tax=Acetonema longum DSM 6540 TaxID=1009370 RepID=F7NN69_9FIRM|nr:hypothetical protein ALO_17761 [Acetonema longum DSM 6540]